MSNLSLSGSIPIEGTENEEEKKENKIHRPTNSCMDKISTYIPILNWLPKYTRMDAVSDLISGITLGLTMIPQSIAYASLAGLTSQYGLYSAFAGSLVYVLFGTIKEVSVGPTSLMSLLTLEFTRDMPIEFVVLLAFLAGCTELVWGILNLGFFTDFISVPVTSGFTSATSIIIIVGQLQGLFGLKYKSTSTIDNFVKLFQHIGDIRTADTVVGVSSILFLLFLKKITSIDASSTISARKRAVIKKSFWILSISRNALLILITTVIASSMEKNGKSPFILSGKVESGLPSFNLPPFTAKFENRTYTFFEMCSHLGSAIIIVPLVAVLANISIAKAFVSEKAVDASQEMRSLGLCNIIGSFVNSMPTCGAFSRSAVSNASGVRTPFSGLYAGIMTLFALSFLTPYFYFIPRSALSAVLVTAVAFMIDWSIIPILWKGSKKDLAAAVGTFIACLLSVEYGLLFGVALNAIYLLRAWARPDMKIKKCKTADGKEYVLIKPNIGMYYPSIDFLRNEINKAAEWQGRNNLPLVLDCDKFKGIDYSGVKGLEAIANEFQTRGQNLILIKLNENILKKIELFGCKKKLRFADGEDFFDLLFEENVDITRSETLPVFKLVEDEGGKSVAPKSKSENIDTIDVEDENREKESLLMEEKKVTENSSE